MADIIETALRSFITENFLFGDDSRAIAGSDSLIQNDLMDSTGILELVAFLEDHFGISVADEDIMPENLDSIDRITAYVTRRQEEQVSRVA
ncbi:MAG: Acyl carrier protein [Saliniramus fredricksonii]|uniref:Acyl carrier protein n=1 Tax=Saliniramus fredricksonii TaxID=1653334 RepID=A0A0P7Y0Z2_9HYPH|nr:acyl carrier protein [Saliniramus fredricksonii]KPQ09985.1 MAG: Acyl carrier protein [Saliniramus fredricksonii]SCC80824.1 Acyl carrier protein [Saliniramus fredricksonii]